MHLFRTTVVTLFTMFAIGSPMSICTAESPAAMPQGLFKYIAQDDAAFDWKLRGKKKTPEGTIYDISLTSQKWHDVVWKHALYVYEPNQVSHTNHMLLFVTGGSIGRQPGTDDMKRGLMLANLCNARVATIHQVPNQPLFGGRVEDDLITDTWLKYLETGDDTWPLLFPMVKSAVKAMDALEALAQEQWAGKVDGFVITGASKRGWTSWLTPVADSRVIATAPLVIDVLNFRAQMKHQIDTWGKYSEQIRDYTSKGLIVEGDETKRERDLRQMMDPYTYRARLTLPKLMVNGTNDPYWVVDAAKWYWSELQGPKYLLQVPNAGHGLDGGHELALSTVAAFFQHAAMSTKMPELTWEYQAEEDTLTLEVVSSAVPEAVRAWTSKSSDKDFRNDQWSSESLDSKSGKFVSQVAKAGTGHVAQYIELQYQIKGLPYSLCTLIFSE